MFGNLMARAVAEVLDILGQLVLWQNCTENWVFPVRDRSAGENVWKRSLPNGQRIDATALALPKDSKVAVIATPGGFSVVPRRSALRPVVKPMGFYGHVEIHDGDIYIVGQYRVSDGWLALYTAVNILILCGAWFIPLPLVMRSVTEQGAAYIDLFSRPGELLAVSLFVMLVIFVLSLGAGAAFLFFRTNGFINKVLNLPERREITGYLNELCI
jgi:hypothetical protein